MECELKFGNHSPVICMAPGLFRSRARVERDDTAIVKIEYPFNDEETYVFEGPELGINDMVALQGVTALASKYGDHRSLVKESVDFPGAMQWTNKKDVYPKHVPKESEHLSISGGFTQLARELGYLSPNSGATHQRIRRSFERLSKVAVTSRVSGKQTCQSVLYIAKDSLEASRFQIALCGLLTRSALPPKGGQYFRIDMEEVRSIGSEPARLLHQRLHWMNPGSQCKIGVDTLCQYVWPKPVDSDSKRRQRHAIKKALKHLPASGWTTTVESESVVVTRLAAEVPPRHWVNRPKAEAPG